MSPTNASKQPFKIQVVNRGEIYLCDQGESLLSGMEQKSADCINVGCRGGGCGMCKIRIIQGSFTSKRMSKAHVSPEEAEQGYALACRTFPSENMVIESDHFQIDEAVELGTS